MKRLSHILVLFFAVMNLMCLPAMAADSSAETIYYEDGSYAIITLTSSSVRASKSDIKAYTYYNPQGQRCFTYRLLASFTYNGVMSRADTAENTVSIYRQGWDMSTHSEYVSGNTAYGRATFTGPSGESRTASLTLTCDKNGTIS